jgi:ribosome biogenesis GTPase
VLKGRATILACGDRVRIARAADGGVIESVAPRTSLFYRSDAFHEKLIAANVTQVCGVAAAGISLDEELIHRWSIAAEAQACRFILAANKSDLPGFDALLARLEPFARLGYRIVGLSATNDVSPLLPWLAGEKTALIGQSAWVNRRSSMRLHPRPARRLPKSRRRSRPAGTRRRTRHCICCHRRSVPVGLSIPQG